MDNSIFKKMDPLISDWVALQLPTLALLFLNQENL